MQEKIKNTFFSYFPKSSQENLTSEYIFLQKCPKIIVLFACNKKESREFIKYLEQLDLYSIEPKKKRKMNLDPFQKLSINKVFCKFSIVNLFFSI